MDKIGIRELRQNASLYVARASKGERIEVTSHGRSMAMLTPIETDWLQQMINEGRVIPAEDPTNPADEEPLDLGLSLSAVVEEMRREERF